MTQKERIINVDGLPNTLKASDNVSVEEWSKVAKSEGTRELGRGYFRDVYHTQDGTIIIEDIFIPYNPLAKSTYYSIVDLNIEDTIENRNILKEFDGLLDTEWGYSPDGFGLPRFSGMTCIEKAYDFVKKCKDKFISKS